MLKTEKLNIVLLSNNHSAHLLNYYKKNKEHLEKWEPKRDSSFYTASFFKRLIIKRLKEIQKGQSVRFVIIPNESNTIIGVCNYTIESDMKCHLGYSISEEYEGKGLMYEALLKTNQYIFDKIDIKTIQASIIIKNQRSNRLLERLLFKYIGKVNNYLEINGKLEDHSIYHLNKSTHHPTNKKPHECGGLMLFCCL
jgi:ribosomal-protein-alanine N-acetyltransferase